MARYTDKQRLDFVISLADLAERPDGEWTCYFGGFVAGLARHTIRQRIDAAMNAERKARRKRGE